MTAAERWLTAMWPIVRRWLPTPPAQVLEIGCGPLGGFVPVLRAGGFDAVGVDPDAPAEAGYRRVQFEDVEPFHGLGAVVASTSLHHVADPGQVIDRIASMLTSGGRVVVLEWDWNAFDQRTAEWCFERLGNEEEGWLDHHRDRWESSREPWSDYLREWARGERLHRADALLRLLDERFDRMHLAVGPYFFPDLAATSEEDERAAIEAREIQATRIDYVGTLR